MSELSVPPLPPEQGERLPRSAYKQEFARRTGELRDADSWKLERRQHFEEQGSPSRDALRRGEWEHALRLMDDGRDAMRAAARENARRGYRFHRVRVVERPLTPYMQWQLHSLRQRAQYGYSIHILGAESVADAEQQALLPEVVVLGGSALFQVLYDDAGAPVGAVRYLAPDLVGRWERYLRALHTRGEDVASYFAREVAPLPPPRLRQE